MVHIVADRVCETSTSTGTGNLTLAGAVAGFQTFAAAMANGDTFFYCIEAVDANGIPTGDWEVGEGTYVSATPAIARTTVLESSNADAAVNFAAGTKRIYVTMAAEGTQTILDLTEDAAPDIAADFMIFYDTSTGTTDRVTPRDLRTQILAAGSAAANSWPILGSGTILTAAVKGAFEHDTNCLYFTTDVGNRGYVPVRHFIRANATRTLPNDTNLNAIFNSPANGRLTLETGTYRFEMVIGITAMSSTSGNALLNVRGAGTATLNDWLYALVGKDDLLTAISGVQGTMPTSEASPASMFTGGAATAMWFTAIGTFTVTAAGTIIPSIDLVTASAAVIAIGSYFMCERIGDVNVVSVGQWD